MVFKGCSFELLFFDGKNFTAFLFSRLIYFFLFVILSERWQKNGALGFLGGFGLGLREVEGCKLGFMLGAVVLRENLVVIGWHTVRS